MKNANRVPPVTFEAVPERAGQRCTIHLAGELDSASVPILTEALRSVDSAEVENLVIDLERLSFIDSTGLQALVSAHQAAEGNSHRLVFRRPTGEVKRTFVLVGLDAVLPIVED
jgi:anti-anti-sigma factor